MNELEIKKFNSPVLRKKAKPVEKITPQIRELVLNMERTMKKNKGIGLAGPQVGVSKRIIVAQLDLRSSKTTALINPEIIKRGRLKEIEQEGCLSFPGISLNIKRPKSIEVEALDIDEREVKMKAKGLAARVIQHEIDHLNGVLFFDRLNLVQKIKFKLESWL